PYPGKIVKQYYQPGEISIKGKPLYDLELADGHTAVPKQQAKLKEAIEPCKKEIASIEKSEVKTALSPESSDALSFPSTRQLAKEMGLDINQIHGTGKDGRVTADDLRAYVKQASSSESSHTALTRLPGDEEVPIIGIKNLMARKMAESKRKIPHFSYFEKV